MRDLKLEHVECDQETNRGTVVLSEEDGDRYLAIAVGVAEGAQIALAWQERRESDSASFATLMASIDRIGGRVECAVITDLVDGVFRARVDVVTDDGRLSLDARPVDAIAMAQIGDHPLYATATVLDAAGVVPIIHATDAGTDPALSEQDKRNLVFTWNDAMEPRAAFPHPQGWIESLMRVLSPFVVAVTVVAAVAGVVFGVLVGAVAFLAWQDGDTAELRSCVRASLLVSGLFGCALALIVIRWVAHRMLESRRAVLEVYPMGVVYCLPTGVTLRAPWSAIEDTGKVVAMPGAPECLRLLTPLQIPGAAGRFLPAIRGIPISNFDSNWRAGELGQLMRRYHPRLLGVSPVDTAGGGVVF